MALECEGAVAELAAGELVVLPVTKLRVYFHFIARTKKHPEEYGIQRVRAVLIEALDRDRAHQLRTEAQHPMVSGGTPTPLFWFTTSELFTKKEEMRPGRPLARFLVRPEVVLMDRADVEQVGALPVDDDVAVLHLERLRDLVRLPAFQALAVKE